MAVAEPARRPVPRRERTARKGPNVDRALRGVPDIPAWRNPTLVAQIVTDVAFVVLIAACIATGHAGDMFVLWMAPALLSVALLAYTFDYLPHRPYDSRERFMDTRTYGGRILNVVLLGQNYHLVHHAWNTITWHRYQRAFDAARDELEAMGARVGTGDYRRPLATA